MTVDRTTTPQPAVRWELILGLIACGAAARLLPHWPNFTPVAALALFGGAAIRDWRWALGVPLAAMALSDLAMEGLYRMQLGTTMGLHAGLPVIYVCFVVIAMLAWTFREYRSPAFVVAGSVVASLFFFAVTNFSVWLHPAFEQVYDRSWAGLAACFAAGLPFLQYTLAGDLFYSSLLFGAYAWLIHYWPAAIRQPSR